MPKRQVTCPHCDKSYGIPSGVKTGQNLRCSRCQEKFTISDELLTEKSGYDPEESTVNSTDDKVLTGQVIGGVKIESIIGKGGMGTVYRGMHQNLDLPVAVKVLAPAFAKKNSTAVDNFIQEARATAKLQHQNIVSVSNVGQEGEHFYITMQYIDGPNLKEKIKKDGPLPEKQVLHIARQMCDALAFAHAKHIVHRDIKPDNILLEANGYIKLADLGLAVQVDPDSDEDGAMTVMGTPAYMPPEQAKKNMAVDHRADIYALGCTLFQLLCGKAPYRGKTVKDTLALHEKGAIPDVRDRNSDVSEGLSQLIQSMMGKTPDDRPASITEVGKQLQAIESGEPAGNAATVATPRKPRVTRNVDTTVRYTPRRGKKGNTGLWIGGAAALLVLLFLLFAGGDDPIEPEAVADSSQDAQASNGGITPSDSTAKPVASKPDAKQVAAAAEPKAEPKPKPQPAPEVKTPDYKSGLILVDYQHNPRSAMAYLTGKNTRGKIADGIDFKGIKGDGKQAFGRHYSGYFNAHKDGLYRFRIATDDGGVLFINNMCVVDNDWIHARIQTTGAIHLKKGRYPFDFIYHQNGGGKTMTVTYSLDGKSYQALKPEDISYDRHYQRIRTFKRRRGLVEYYSSVSVTNCEQVRNLTFSTRQVVKKVAITTRKADHFAYRWKGMIYFPKAAEYTFYLRSNDGSRLYIDNHVAINHDGYHDMTPQKQVKRKFNKGYHNFELLYFETKGNQGIELLYSVDGSAPAKIPNKWFHHWEPQ